MKFKIDADGRTVELECADANVTITSVVTEVLAVWRMTGPAKPAGFAGPGIGFSAERRAIQASPMNMGGYGNGYVREPRAEGGNS